MTRNPLLALSAMGVAFLISAGCGIRDTPPKAALPSKYVPMPKREAPDWLKGSIYEQVDVTTTEPFRVSNFGLVVLKHPTGDAQSVPNLVREYMQREMQKRQFGSKNAPGYERMTPDVVLRDPHYAIVRVDAFIPPGAALGQRVDVQVSALDDTNTTSLATGKLYTTNLMPNGANPRAPGVGVENLAYARGYVFVNPAYAFAADSENPDVRRSLTSGIIMNGGRISQSRPLGLRIRSAERRTSRMIEYRIDQLLADGNGATAMDEGTVYVNVPAKYRGDWEHFAGVLLHTYFNTDSAFIVIKAKELAAEAVKPDAALLDISYTWESLGEGAIPEILPLMTHPTPEVAFAAARAAAFIGDHSAELALSSMARDAANPFRVNAVTTLGALPVSPSVNTELRELMTIGDPLVRVEAYRALARNEDPSIYSKTVDDKFIVDIVPSDAPPLIYATRSGMPRIAFLGQPTRIADSTFFSAMNNALTISRSPERAGLLSIFYRGATNQEPVQQLATADLPEIIARFGGEGAPGQPRFDFTYGEIIAILGKMSDGGFLRAPGNALASFVLQDSPGGWNRDVDTAPIIPDGPRPIGGESKDEAPLIPDDTGIPEGPRPIGNPGTGAGWPATDLGRPAADSGSDRE